MTTEKMWRKQCPRELQIKQRREKKKTKNKKAGGVGIQGGLRLDGKAKWGKMWDTEKFENHKSNGKLPKREKSCLFSFIFWGEKVKKNKENILIPFELK